LLGSTCGVALAAPSTDTAGEGEAGAEDPAPDMGEEGDAATDPKDDPDRISTPGVVVVGGSTLGHAPGESPSLVLVINDTKLLMLLYHV
jgi:hypothetical protein